MRKLLTIISIALLIIILYIYCNDKENSTLDVTVNNIVNTDTTTFIPPTIDYIIEKGVPKNNKENEDSVIYETSDYSVIKGVISPGQAIGQILGKYNISNTDIYKLEQASKNIFDLRNIQSGKPYTVICSKDSNSVAKCFIYQKSKIEYVVFDFRDTITVRLGEKAVVTKTNIIKGSINQGGGLWYSISKKLGDLQ